LESFSFWDIVDLQSVPTCLFVFFLGILLSLSPQGFGELYVFFGLEASDAELYLLFPPPSRRGIVPFLNADGLAFFSKPDGRHTGLLFSSSSPLFLLKGMADGREYLGPEFFFSPSERGFSRPTRFFPSGRTPADLLCFFLRKTFGLDLRCARWDSICSF